MSLSATGGGYLLLPITVLLALTGSSDAALPPGWKACRSSDPEYSRCLIKEFTHALTTLVNGNKKMALLPLDPLRVSRLEIPSNSGPVNLNLLFNNLDIIGIKSLHLSEARNNWKDLEATGYIPDLYVLGDYRVNGKVLVLPITGSGKCNLTFHELTLKIKVTWKTIEKGGKQYFQMEKILLSLTPKRLYIYLENLFNGDKALGDNMNNFLNENWEQILGELSPGITSALSQAFTQIANLVLSRIPAEDINKP